MARRNLVRKSILKRKNAFLIGTQADVTTTDTTTSSLERQEPEVYDEREPLDVPARDSLEVLGGPTPASPTVIDEDDSDYDLGGSDDYQFPSHFSVMRRNRLYRIPDHYFSDAQHQTGCGCCYCQLLYPKDGSVSELVVNQ